MTIERLPRMDAEMTRDNPTAKLAMCPPDAVDSAAALARAETRLRKMCERAEALLKEHHEAKTRRCRTCAHHYVDKDDGSSRCGRINDTYDEFRYPNVPAGEARVERGGYESAALVLSPDFGCVLWLQQAEVMWVARQLADSP